MNGFAALDTRPIGIMLLKRQQLDAPAAALDKSCPILTRNRLYTKFGIDSKHLEAVIEDTSIAG